MVSGLLHVGQVAYEMYACACGTKSSSPPSTLH